MKKNRLHIILVFATALLLVLPIYQMVFKPLDFSLSGVSNKQELPEFGVKDWIDFKYQPRFHQYLQDHYGFREPFIRTYNQVQYSLFGKWSNKNIILGKDGYLFEPWFIKSYYGLNFRGEDPILDKVKKLKAIQDTLKYYGKDLMMVIAPGKVTYYPEYIPDNKRRAERTESNYSFFVKSLKEYGVNTVDCNSWFAKAKDTTHVPLFPRTGTHWSIYGAQIAADSLFKNYAQLSGKTLNEVQITDLNRSIELKFDDIDLEEVLNLHFELERDTLAYPVKKKILIEGAEKPNLFVISDSFFWNIFNFWPIHNHIFNEVSYWYYYSKGVYPKKTKTDLSIRLAKSDLIMFMSATSTLGKFGWEGVDEMYNYFYGENADSTFAQKVENKEDFVINETYDAFVERFKIEARDNAERKEKIEIKAKERGVSFEEMLDRDAHWVAKRKYGKK